MITVSSIARLALFTAFLLIIPMFGNRYVDGWHWTAFDFVWAGMMIFGSGLGFLIVSQKSTNALYKSAVGLGVLTTFMLLWVNAAVGIIGDGPVKVLYWAVPAVGLFGAVITRLRADGLAWVLFAMACTQMLVPVIALIAWGQTISWSPGIPYVFALNAFFAALYVAAGFLFRKASQAYAGAKS